MPDKNRLECVASHVDENDGSRHQSRCYKCLTRIGCKWIANLPRRWPRIYSLMVGVILPLLGLIVISLLFGYFLALAEYPYEVASNNESIAASKKIQKTNNLVRDVSAALPTLCLELYINRTANALNEPATSVDEYLQRLAPRISMIIDGFLAGNDTTQDIVQVHIVDDAMFSTEYTLNLTSFVEFMHQCGQVAAYLSNELTARVMETIDSEILPLTLTFDWVRCSDNGLFPSVQEETAVQQWEESQSALFDQYMQEYLMAGMNNITARAMAFKESYKEATGFDQCHINLAAASWFWFTVMSTVGYGNIAPGTVTGRLMVYTLGFLSILAFGCVLAKAGIIMTAVVDDWNNAPNRKFLTKPWVGCIVWGILYFGWNAAIAGFTKAWKQVRLGEDLDYGDMYWMAYISTTTVGLGDFYYESEVILTRDLIILYVMFLTGFVLLSDFFVKLLTTLVTLLPSRWKSLKDTLEAMDSPTKWITLTERGISEPMNDMEESAVDEHGESALQESAEIGIGEPLNDMKEPAIHEHGESSLHLVDKVAESANQ